MEKILREILCKAVSSHQSPVSNVEIEIPREEGYGDLSTPMAMGLARTMKKPPRKIAEDLINSLEDKGIFEKIEIAGPGFLNFTFTRSFLCEELKQLLQNGEGFLKEDIGQGRKIQIEFVSANPTGPLHLGHGRGAALGAALASLLTEAGYDVEKEYYINDAGRQVKLLGLSVYAKYQQLSGREYPFPEDGYRGDYIDDLAREFHEACGNKYLDISFDDASAAVIDFSYKKMLDAIRKDLEDFGVVFEKWQSEKEIYERGDVTQAIEDLKNRDHIYEQDEALWFRSTTFGDDKDRVIIKKDGEYTYFASDIAYHRNKVERGFHEIIDIWGADHHGYIPRVQAVIEALGYPKDHLKVLLVQMVSLLRAGTPVQMSKRSGEFITLKEVVDEIGPDTTKFLFLTRRPDSHLEVDIEVAKAQSNENPVFYVQYAHARIKSIFEKAKSEGQGSGGKGPELT
ncbi:MAG: arginine--tRNA ligase, partial [Nitrospirales bacterium]|nr:arginine--tRNA ligase [Nitrospirales bacterium]